MLCLGWLGSGRGRGGPRQREPCRRGGAGVRECVRVGPLLDSECLNPAPITPGSISEYLQYLHPPRRAWPTVTQMESTCIVHQGYLGWGDGASRRGGGRGTTCARPWSETSGSAGFAPSGIRAPARLAPPPGSRGGWFFRGACPGCPLCPQLSGQSSRPPWSVQ